MSSLVQSELFSTGPDPYLLQEHIVFSTDNALTQGLAYDPTDGLFHIKTLPAGTIGDVIGPAVSVMNQVPTFADATGKVLQASNVTVDGGGNMLVPTGDVTVSAGDVTVTTGSLLLSGGSATVTNGNITASNGNISANNGDVTAGGNLVFPSSGTATSGVVTLSGDRFLHVGAANSNIFLGRRAGNFTLTGPSNIGIGSRVVPAAGGPGSSLTTGIFNTLVGNQSGIDITSGSFNTCFGHSAGENLTTTDGNSCFGRSAGENITGSNNIAIGHLVLSSAGVSDTIAVGYTGAVITGDIRIGTLGTHLAYYAQGVSGATTAGAAVAVLVDAAGQLGTISSSLAYKDQVATLLPEKSSLIHQLRPVSFVYKKEQRNEDGSRVAQFGLIAEEVAEVLPEVVVFKDSKPETVRYDALFAFLLAEIQHLRAQVESIKK